MNWFRKFEVDAAYDAAGGRKTVRARFVLGSAGRCLKSTNWIASAGQWLVVPILPRLAVYAHRYWNRFYEFSRATVKRILDWSTLWNGSWNCFEILDDAAVKSEADSEMLRYFRVWVLAGHL